MTHRGEAVKKGHMPNHFLGPLITSKTALKLLLRFFLNQNLSGYLQGLSKVFDKSTKSVSIELNRLEEAGLHSAEEQGRRKVYSVKTAHPLSTDLSNMLQKVTGVDLLFARIGDTLEQGWVTRALAMGINSEELEVTMVGETLDADYLYELMSKVETFIENTLNWRVRSSGPEINRETALLVW